MITPCRPFLSPNQVIKAGIGKLVARLVWIFELSLPHFKLQALALYSQWDLENLFT